MHFAKVTNDELKAFYAARAAIEEDYSKKLLQLSRKPLGSSETGTLRMSCDVVRAEVESMGKAHQSVAQQMHTELEEPLQAFAGGMKERRKIVQNGIEKLLKLKMQQTATVNKARDRYEQDCLKIKGFLAQAHMVMGHEERKNKARLEKTQINLSTTSAEYETAVKILEETTGRWNRDWKAACDVSWLCMARITATDGSTEIPGPRRRAHRLHQKQFVELRQHRLDRLCQRRCIVRKDAPVPRRLRRGEGYNKLHHRDWHRAGDSRPAKVHQLLPWGRRNIVNGF